MERDREERERERKRERAEKRCERVGVRASEIYIYRDEGGGRGLWEGERGRRRGWGLRHEPGSGEGSGLSGYQ